MESQGQRSPGSTGWDQSQVPWSGEGTQGKN